MFALGPPRVLFANATSAQGPMVQLAPQRRGTPKSLFIRPTVTAVGQVYYGPQVELTYSRRGRPSSHLAPPTVVAYFLARSIHITLAPQSRGKTRSFLLPVPSAFQPFRPTITHLAYAPTRARAKPRLSAPAVVAPVLARPIDATFTRIRPARTNWVLRRPADLVDRDDVGLTRTHLAYSLRGKPKSKLSPPAVVAPVLARPIDETLIRVRPRPTTTRLFPPTVVFTAVELSGPEVTLAPQPRGVPKSHLSAPAVVTAAQVAVYYGPKVATARSFRGTPKSRLLPVPSAFQPFRPAILHLAYSTRGKAKPTLFKPAVVAPVLARAIDTTFAPQKRGIPKSALRPPVIPPVAPPIAEEIAVKITLASFPTRQAHYRLSPPAVVAPVLARAIETTLVRIRPARTEVALRAPVVVYTAVELSGPEVALAYSRRGTPKSFLNPPVPAETFPPVSEEIAVQLAVASFRRREPVYRLSPPQVVYLAVELSGPVVELARIRPPRTTAHLIPPTVVGPVLAQPISVTLTRIRPVRTETALRPPTVVFSATPSDAVADITLARITPPAVHSRLQPPTVVAPVLARAIDVTLAPQTRGAPKSTLRPPVIPPIAPPLAEELAVRITLASLPTREAHSRLSPPTVVGEVLATPIHTTLVRITPPRTQYVLRRPVDLVDRDDLGYVRAHLAYSLRGTPKPRLQPPAVVAPVLARPIDVTVAQIRPVRTVFAIRPPTVVELAVEIYGPETTLAPSFRGTPKSFLSAPVDLVDREDVGSVRTHLAYSLRGAPKSFLRPMGSAAVVYAPLEIKLAPSTRLARAPHFRLAPPTVIDNRPQTYYLAVALAYSRRGKPKSKLLPPPRIQATAKAETVLAATLAYSRRGRPKPKLSRPTRVNAATAYLRPIDTTLVRIRPVRTLALLRRPTDTVGIEDQGSVQVTLAASFRGRPKPKLFAPIVVFAFVARPTSVKLVRIRPVATRYVLRRPTDLVDQQDVGSVSTQLAYSRRGTPKPFFTGVVYDARSYAPITTTLAPQSRGKTRSFLPETVYAARSYAPVRVLLAPSTRLTRAPRSFLVPPTVVSAFTARPLDITLAPQSRRPAYPKLPLVVYDARSYAPVKVVFAPSPRIDRAPHSRLAAPTVVARFYARPTSVTLAPQSRGKTASFLTLTTITARVYGAIRVYLAPSTRIDRTPHSRLAAPTVVARFLATPISVTFARTPRIPTSTFLREPNLATPGFPGPTVTLARIRPPRTVARVLPPAVVNPYVAPISTFISVNLAYSVRGRPIHHLGFIPGLSHGGIVCGVILDLTGVCQDITTDASTIIPGGVLETHVVSEETTASTVIMGETLAETRVDQEIE